MFQMVTIFDWVTMAIFGGLVVLFLQRSAAPGEKQDKIYHYAPPAVGCALANYLGNHGQGTVALAIVLAILAYIIFFMKPFGQRT